jgi:hypothetical protein
MAGRTTSEAGAQGGIGRRGVGARAAVVLTVLFAALTVWLLYTLLAFWPPSYETNVTTAPETRADYLGQTIVLDRERSLLVLVAVAGATGAMGHVLRSFFRYVGDRKLVWSWVPSYVLIPLVGAVLAVITYVVVRAGLITGGTGGLALGNPFGFAAIGMLVGLFSGQAAEKLKEVFETLFAPTQAGEDSLGTETAPTIHSFDPTEGRAGDAIAIVGIGLEPVTSVEFEQGKRSPAEWDAGAGVLRTTVPAGAETGSISVLSGTATASSIDPFIVLDDAIAAVDDAAGTTDQSDEELDQSDDELDAAPDPGSTGSGAGDTPTPGAGGADADGVDPALARALDTALGPADAGSDDAAAGQGGALG